MTSFKLVVQSFRHYLKANIWVALGIAVSTAVITGGLIVGDSVKYSLSRTVEYRLGNVTHALQSGDRYFTASLAGKLNQQGISASASLKLEGIASAQGGQLKINKVQVWGIDDNFSRLNTSLPPVNDNSALISQNLARKLNLSLGDEFQLRIKKGSLLPANAPFVSDEHQTASVRLKVGAILDQDHMGRLSLQNAQTAPCNLFLPITQLNRLSDMNNRANILLINSDRKYEDLAQAIRSSWTLDDAGLSLIESPATGEWELRSARVFMEPAVTTMISNTGYSATPLLTYFANSFKSAANTTPYSFVSSLPDTMLRPDNVVINSWLASDLKVRQGDSITLSFFEIGPLRELKEKSHRFKIDKIEPLNGYFADRLLMPDIPGLSNAENCRDWQTGVPINLKSIRKTDEAYWYTYRGVPKAFIPYSQAVKLWGNRFGNATAFRFNQMEASREELIRALTEQCDPFNFDIRLREVKKEGLLSANNGTDFSSLFIGLSFFILVAGLLLTSLLFIFSLEKRSGDIGTLSSLGFPAKKIRQMFLAEGCLIALMGTLPGLALAVAYNELVFWGLNRVWNDIVRTDLLISHYSLISFLTGFLISIIVSVGTIAITMRRNLGKSVVQLQRKQKNEGRQWVRSFKRITAIVLSLAGLGILIMQLVSVKTPNSEYFFMAGGALLFAFLLYADLFLTAKRSRPATHLTTIRLIGQNLRESSNRSLMVILLLAIGTFVIISTGMNRLDLSNHANDKKSGTGGFLFYAESTVPVLHNLNDPHYRNDQGFSQPFTAVQFSVADGDDASCLNLNRIANPRILGVDPSLMEGRFTFQSFAEGVPADKSWNILNDPVGVCIPAIADQTVIQWSLGKKVGDTLVYKNPAGEEIKLKLMAGLANSVFQGNVLISQNQFLHHFPSISGSNVFLIDAAPDNKASVADDLDLNFKEMGWEMTTTTERLATFNSIENTYLAIFLALGALGLLIGTFGLVIVLQRAILSRKAEFSLLMAVGLSKQKIVSIILGEYLFLLIAGIVGGFISSIIAVWPAATGKIESVPVSFVSLLMTIILINGLIWIVLIARQQLKQLRMVESLRNE